MLAIWTWILVVCLVLLGLYKLSKSLSRERRPDEPPIVKGSFLLGSAGDFSRHAVDFLLKSTKTYGDVFTIRLVNQHITVIMDPHSYDDVSREKNFDFDPIQKQVNRNVFSYELIDAKKMLTATTKTVKGEMMSDALESFTDNLSMAFEKMSGGVKGPVNNGKVEGEWQSTKLREFASETIFDAIFNTIYGRDADHRFTSNLAYENFEQFHKYFNYLWLGFPICLFPKASKALNKMLCMPDSSELLGRSDLSVYMRRALEFMLEHGQTEHDIVGHNLVYLHVNYNTFRLAFWVLHDLLTHPEALAALGKEINELVTDKRKPGESILRISIKDLDSLKVLDSVVQESCRLASGVFMVRYITDDTYFSSSSGKKLLMRKGDRVALYPPALHKDPEIFEDPQVFKYDRFVDAKFYHGGKELKHPVMGFGTICPGKRYALLQLKWFILTVITRFDLQLQQGQRAEYDTAYYGHEILPPVSDVKINFRHRNNYPRMSFAHNSDAAVRRDAV